MTTPNRRQNDGHSPTIITAIIAFIVVLPATIASVTALIVSISTKDKVEVTATKVDDVHKATNSMKDALVAAALLAGRQQGAEEEKQRALTRSMDDAASRSKGAKDEKQRADEARKP